MKFSYRQYQDGDAVAINQLYFEVTGRVRTVEQHAWQWLQSPAGQSEMWLIEAELEDGRTKLIGHHGVMAEDFTYQGKSIRVGKTENTMVLPEFREKILYPRFERAFLKNYEGKFHALFSTTGPAAAIRLREAMGYKFTQEWRTLFKGFEPRMSASLILDRFFRHSPLELKKIFEKNANDYIDGVQFTVLEPTAQDFDFDDFWQKASAAYGITPNRSRANLNWRFWSNPYHDHITIKLTSLKWGTCIAVVSSRNGRSLYVNDLFTDNKKNTHLFFDLIFKWAHQKTAAACIQSVTTQENIHFFSENHKIKQPYLHRISSLIRQKSDTNIMPRKITNIGNSMGLNDATAWYVTPFYFEGR